MIGSENRYSLFGIMLKTIRGPLSRAPEEFLAVSDDQMMWDFSGAKPLKATDE